jgi:hypothetical protein
VAVALLAVLPVPQDVLAESHVVSPADLHQQVLAAAKVRQQRLESVQTFFASPRAKSALKSAKMDSQKVQGAIAQMNDEELAQMAAKTNQLQKDFAAGALTNQQLTYIIIALATAVIIIVLIKA